MYRSCGALHNLGDPLYPEMTDEQIAAVVAAVREAMQRVHFKGEKVVNHQG